MALKANLRHFLNEDGDALELTEQAKIIFKFLTKIVSSASEHIDQPLFNIDLQCNTRAVELSCRGGIKVRCSAIGMIEWYCDTCQACGTISNWQGSVWDKQERIIH
tara:strand:+ start:561 stop:878 length:318 start_codon:yes stop_codon:yes gene_type:complete